MFSLCRQLSKLEAEGNHEEVARLKTESEWDTALRKVGHERVEDLHSISNKLKRAERAKKNTGKKLKEVMERQKHDKHKRLLKKSSNLRERKVERLAKKMKRFSKKGVYIPAFM